MRVLWFSSGLDGIGIATDSYFGGGWVASLMGVVAASKAIELHVAYLSDDVTPFSKGGVSFHPVKRKTRGRVSKILWYYGGYRHQNGDAYLPEALSVMDSVRPDLVQVFGMESEFSCVVGKVPVPVVVHIQGILYECAKGFFPPGMDGRFFLKSGSPREWLYRNGVVFNYKEIKVKARIELERYSKVPFLFGRTDFDLGFAREHAPQARYFRMDEVLRPVFYRRAGEHKIVRTGSMKLFTTASETVYKGLDVILRAGKLLKEEYGDDYQWVVAGIRPGSEFVGHFERFTGISSAGAGIRYAGSLSSEHLVDEMLKADFYVHTSYCDNSPNSLCEAMMLGLPCLASNAMGIPSLVSESGHSGLLFDSGDYRSLANKVMSLRDDAELKEQFGRGAFLAAWERHDRDRILSDITDAYGDIVG